MQGWRQALLSDGSTLQDAIKNLVDTALQIALVVTSDGVLIGTVTDGDIRRGLLRGLRMDASLTSIVNRDPLVVPTQLGRDLVLQLMQANRIHQLPVVDERRRVVGLHIWDVLMVRTVRANPVVVMAGGQGSRLRPHTDTCPKPLLPVAGKPMLEHIIIRAKLAGFSHFIIAIHYLGHMIEEYFGDGSRWDVEIRYLRERSPLGTAGALRLVDAVPGVPLVVTNADVLTDIKYDELLDFHDRNSAAGTMAVRLHEWQHPFGVIQTKGVDIVGFEEKPITRSHVNAGIYVLDPAALDLLAQDERCDMPTLFTRMQQRGDRTIVYPMHEPWMDVGRPDDYHAANRLE